jgi:hypothetical protein
VLVHDIWPCDRRDDPTEATYSADDLARVQQDVAQLARYTVEMGGTFALLEAALKIPPWEPIHQLSREELRAMKMATIEDQPSETASALALQPTQLRPPLHSVHQLRHGTEGVGAERQLEDAAANISVQQTLQSCSGK